MTKPDERLAKLIAHYAMDEAASRQVRRLPAFALPQHGNDRLISLLEKLDETQAAATTASRARR
jgi:hypothetical protein